MPSSKRPKHERPNILLLVGEQHNTKVLGVAGHPLVKTPNLDSLAARGVYFPNAYSATPLCVPGRVAMLTGLFGSKTGVTKNIYTDMVGDLPTLPRQLRKAGYRTCHIGKTHLATGAQVGTEQGRKRFYDLGFDEDFATTGKMGAGLCQGDGPYVSYIREKGLDKKLSDDYRKRLDDREFTLADAHPSVVNTEDYHDQWVSRTAANWLSEVQTDKPFYLSVNWIGPHAMRDAPGKYAEMYDPADIDPPIEDNLAGAPQELRQRQQQTLSKLKKDDWRKIRSSYYGMISLIDGGIGEILKVLDTRGLLDNTIIVYTADHGEMLCDHGFVYKTMMYEQSAAVPLIISYPEKFASGHVSGSTASQVDIAPTLLDVAKAEAIKGAHGVSLLEILENKTEHTGPAFCQWQTTTMIRSGQYKYIYDPNWECDQLFDLENDPNEVNNISKANSELVNKFKEMISNWQKQIA